MELVGSNWVAPVLGGIVLLAVVLIVIVILRLRKEPPSFGDETTHYEAVKLLLDGWSDTM